MAIDLHYTQAQLNIQAARLGKIFGIEDAGTKIPRDGFKIETLGPGAALITIRMERVVDIDDALQILQAIPLDDEPATTPEAPTDNAGLPRSIEQRVSVEYIQEQRAAGWPNIHPEDHCHRCGNRNLSWWVDSTIWEAAMVDAFTPFDGIVCPSCFAAIWAETWPDTTWELRLSPDTRGARAYLAAPSRAADRLTESETTDAP